jgi:hypothetical protein
MKKRQFTEGQIMNWVLYELIRSGSVYNMLDPRAIKMSGLSKEDYMFVINNYDALKAAYSTTKAK